MKLRTSALLAASLLAFSWSANAEDEDDATRGCTLSTVTGAYSFSQSGSVVGLAAIPLPAADVGIMVSDGAGGVSGSETINVAGALFTAIFTNGTYTVNPDCSGTASWTSVYSGGRPPQLRTAAFVIANKGRELHILSTGPNAVLVGIAHKQ